MPSLAVFVRHANFVILQINQKTWKTEADPSLCDSPKKKEKNRNLALVLTKPGMKLEDPRS